MTPTQLSIRLLRQTYSLVEVTEHWNPFARVRKDLFGFVDVLAVGNGEAVAVQTTSAANVSARLNKILSLPGPVVWLQSPSRRLLVHGWAKRNNRWQCRVVELTWNPAKGVEQKP